MSTFTVTSLTDSGAGTLRDAIAEANAAGGSNTITFDPSLAGGTLVLTQGELDITSNTTIDGDINGDGKPDITIDANNNSRIFSISGAAALDSLKLTGGDADYGGAVRVYSPGVTITDSDIYGNSASSSGGGIYVMPNAGVALLDDAIFDNHARVDGGGIADIVFNRSSLSLTNVTLTGNSAAEGGAIYSAVYTPLTNVTITGNSASSVLATYSGGVLATSGLALTNSIVTDGLTGAGSASLSFEGGNILGSSPSNFFPVTGSYTLIDGSNRTDLQSVFASVGHDPKTGVLSGLLRDNGGAVPTVALNDSASNPAIDAGDDALAPPTDARGFTRSDFPGVANNGTNISDLGAFEQQQPQTFVVTTLNDELDSTDPHATLADESGGRGCRCARRCFWPTRTRRPRTPSPSRRICRAARSI